MKFVAFALIVFFTYDSFALEGNYWTARTSLPNIEYPNVTYSSANIIPPERLPVSAEIYGLEYSTGINSQDLPAATTPKLCAAREDDSPLCITLNSKPYLIETHEFDGLPVETTFWFEFTSNQYNCSNCGIPFYPPAGVYNSVFVYYANPGFNKASFGKTNQLTHKWSTISVNPVEKPVVIAGIPTTNATHPGVVQIRKVDEAGSFQIRFREWKYLVNANKKAHKAESVAYMVLRKGFYKEPKKSWAVGTFTLRYDGPNLFKKISFIQNLTCSDPDIYTTPQTVNDNSEAFIVRVTDHSEQGFQATMVLEEARVNQTHAAERIGYVAICEEDQVGKMTQITSLQGQAFFMLSSIEMG